MLERVDALIFLLKVSRVSRGVHGQQAIFSLLLLICTVNLREFTGYTVNNAICCQLSMRSKDRVGALAVSGLRDDGRESPSLSALYRVWPACPGGLLSHKFFIFALS